LFPHETTYLFCSFVLFIYLFLFYFAFVERI
jgi:hypothetical protein